MCCQCPILNILWFHFVCNSDVPEAFGQRFIDDIICQCRLGRLFSHVVRMSDSAPANAILRVVCDIREGVHQLPIGTDCIAAMAANAILCVVCDIREGVHQLPIGTDCIAACQQHGFITSWMTLIFPLKWLSFVHKIDSIEECTLQPLMLCDDDDDDGGSDGDGDDSDDSHVVSF